MLNMSKLRVEFEDENLIVVYKPAGLLSQRDESGEACVVDLVRKYLYGNDSKDSYVGLVHRIDRPVAGLLVIAKNKRATELMSRLFKRDRVRKKYSTIVFGKPLKDKAELKHFILERDKQTSLVYEAVPERQKVKEAILEYQVQASGLYNDIKEFGGELSLLSVRLITGRKHQIRAQLSFIGHPIVGDSRYFLQKGILKDKMLRYNFLPWGEIALCANYISFPHPLDNGKIIEVETKLPEHWIKFF